MNKKIFYNNRKKIENHELNNKVILLTGGLKGIGKTICEYLVEKNYKVYGTTRNSEIELLTFLNGKKPYQIMPLDVTSQASIDECVKTIIKKEHRIDILINNAGSALCGELLNTPIDDIKSQFDTNFYGAIRMIQTIIPYMQKNNDNYNKNNKLVQKNKQKKFETNGIIINIGSIGGRVPLPYQSMYVASKAALASMTDSLRIELKKYKIQTSLIEPGDTATSFNESRKLIDGFYSSKEAVKAIETMHKDEQNGLDPIKIAEKIYQIISTYKNLKPRYTLGYDAKLIDTVQRFLPRKLQEMIIVSKYG